MAILSKNGIINMMPFQSLLAGCISIQNICGIYSMQTTSNACLQVWE